MILIVPNSRTFILELQGKPASLTTFLFEDCFDCAGVPLNLQMMQDAFARICNMARAHQKVQFGVSEFKTFRLTIYCGGDIRHHILAPTTAKAIWGWRLIHHDL